MRRESFEFQLAASKTLHVLPGFTDNYFYVLEEQQTRQAAAVDPGSATDIIELLRAKNLSLSHILLTHHHRDHTGGLLELKHIWPNAQVICSPWFKLDIPGAKEQILRVTPGEIHSLWDFSLHSIDTRGHTLDQIAFSLGGDTLSSVTDVFVGDALFGAGCGGLFEGSHPQMLDSLKRLRSLPEPTRIWCAHEYTLKNLRVAALITEHNGFLKDRLERLEFQLNEAQCQPHELSTLPLLLGEEIATNPFLRWDSPTLQKAIDTSDDLATFKWLRTFRDRF